MNGIKEKSSCSKTAALGRYEILMCSLDSFILLYFKQFGGMLEIIIL